MLLPPWALHVALALHWFGSSIQQFTKSDMLSLGHAGVSRASLALVVLCQCGIGLGGVALRFALLLCDGWGMVTFPSLTLHVALALHSFRSSISTINKVGISLSWSCLGGLGR